MLKLQYDGDKIAPTESVSTCGENIYRFRRYHTRNKYSVILHLSTRVYLLRNVYVKAVMLVTM